MRSNTVLVWSVRSLLLAACVLVAVGSAVADTMSDDFDGSSIDGTKWLTATSAQGDMTLSEGSGYVSFVRGPNNPATYEAAHSTVRCPSPLPPTTR